MNCIQSFFKLMVCFVLHFFIIVFLVLLKERILNHSSNSFFLFISLFPIFRLTALYKENYQLWHSKMKTLLLLSLPEQNQMAFHFLSLLLIKIIQNSQENKMDSPNVAIVFAPNLLRSPGGDPLSAIQDSQKCTNCIRHLIDHSQTLILSAPSK